MRALSALFAATLVSGCVIYDNECPDDGYGHDGPDYDDTGHDRPDRPDGDDTGDTGEDPGPDEAAFFLDPDTTTPGQVFIASLTSDQAVDFGTIVDITFLSDDVVLCTFQARADELLLTIGVEDTAALGPIDLIVAFEGGENVYVDDALEVIADDGGTGGGGGGGGGTGEDGICG